MSILLYVSRYIDRGTYGVVDTDDGIEEQIDICGISDAVCLHGVRIAGVTPVINKRFNKGYVTEDGVRVYQPVETLSPLQVKTKVLKHIDVKVYKSMITGIDIDIGAIEDKVQLRLSDFGTFCADYILSGNNHGVRDKVVLILDDKITFGKKTFKLRQCDNSFVGIRDAGVMFDLSEMNDDNAAALYKVLLSGQDLFPTVIDEPTRYNSMTIAQYRDWLHEVT